MSALGTFTPNPLSHAFVRGLMSPGVISCASESRVLMARRELAHLLVAEPGGGWPAGAVMHPGIVSRTGLPLGVVSTLDVLRIVAAG